MFIFWIKLAGYFRSGTEKSHFYVRPWALLILNSSARVPTDNGILMSLILLVAETMFEMG